MKKIGMVLMAVLLTFPLAACGDDNDTPGSETPGNVTVPDDNDSGNTDTTDIVLTVGDIQITATLTNSATTRDFLATLPRTLTLTRYGDREYYGRIAALSEAGESIDTFSNGDVTYYPAGPSLAIFFAKDSESRQSGLIRMGRITSALSDFDYLGNQVEVRIEVAE